MGILQRDLEELTSNKADEIAQQRCGREFGDLPPTLQMQVWMDAEHEAEDYFRTQDDGIYERIREGKFSGGGNGHKPKEDREAYWAELELQRRLGK